METLRAYAKAIKEEGTPLGFAIADLIYMFHYNLKYYGEEHETLANYLAQLDRVNSPHENHRKTCRRAVLENLVYPSIV